MQATLANLEMLMTLAQGGGKPGVGIWLMAIGFVLICVIMMLVVLIQKPKGGGLSGAFGGGAGGGSTQAVIGARVGDVLTIVTVVCFVLFLVLAMGMTLAIKGTDDTAAEPANTETVEGEGATSPEATVTPPATIEPAVTPDLTPEAAPAVTPEVAPEPAPAPAAEPAP